MRLPFLFAFFFFAAGKAALATHIVGGEITYQCLGGENFQITLTVYRDCYNGEVPFDSVAILGVYKTGTDSLYKVLYLPFNHATNDTLPIVVHNPCLVVPPIVCVHKAVYSVSVALPYRPDGYTIVNQRCCRNKLIRNIPSPVFTGISYVAIISGKALLECNHAAVFKQWPPVAVCAQHPIDFDHSAQDADGDVLRYRLCTPYDGPELSNSNPDPPAPPPYPELQWIDPPYNLSNLMGGVPLTIDSVSGFMTGIPGELGNYVVGVCIDEYRDGELLSTTRRDFQYNVVSCGQANAAFFAPAVLCDTLAVAFENHSQFSNDFQWYFNWPDDLSQPSTQSSPVHVYPDTGWYKVLLIASPNTACSDSAEAVVHLIRTGQQLQLTATPEQIPLGGSSQLQAQMAGATGFSWLPQDGLSDAGSSSPIATPAATTTYLLTVTLDSGCEKSDTITVRVAEPTCAEPYVFLPTGFSPNGDGENDALQLESNIAVEVYWSVFNRWGEKLFEAVRPEDAWDGRYRGVDQPAETYGYYLRVGCTDGSIWEKSGNITLIR